MLGLQSALAAHACMMPSGRVNPAVAMRAMSTDASMAVACAQMKPAAADRMLCAKHCAPDASAPTAAHPLSVPPNALVALPPAPLVADALTSPMTAQERQRDRLRAPPPAGLLFCSLLI
jgi:hypothetical protein